MTKRGLAPQFVKDALLYTGDECLLWPFGHNGLGYGKLGGKYIHRLACEAEHGPPPTPKHEAAHLCGNGQAGCVTRRHLLWKTHAENMADVFLHGTHNRGERSGSAKLTEADVRAIRSLRGIRPQEEIAGMFGVSRPTVSSIHTGQNWGWLEC